MKKLLIVASLTTLSAGVLAETAVPANYGYVGLHLSKYFFDIGGHYSNPDFDPSLLPGAQFGLRFKDQWSVQGWWEDGDLDNADGGGDASFTHYFISARHHYRKNEFFGFEPYTGAAMGHQKIDSDDETLGAFEFGLQRGLGKQFVLDLGARPTYSFDNERWDGQLYAAINLVVGSEGSARGDSAPRSVAEVVERKVEQAQTVAKDTADQAKSAVIAVVDSDGDGVADPLDRCPGTRAGAKVDADGCQVTLSEDIRETLYVQFATGGTSVADASIEEIGRVARRMQEYPDARLMLEGHTDSSGSADQNRQLSQQRADAVKQVMIDRFNVDAARIDAVGRGEDAPAFSNDTAEGRAKNRRVEAILQAQKTIEVMQ
jgi:OmpA-OmpF porin, OOP family